MLLFTGDEKGSVRIWDLTHVVKILERMHHFKPLRSPVRCDNPCRAINYDASVELEEEKNNQKEDHSSSKYEDDANEDDEGSDNNVDVADQTFMTTTGSLVGGKKRVVTKNSISDGPMPLISPMA